MLRSFPVVALAFAAPLASGGCYQPSLGTCELRCNASAAEPGQACPAGLSCSNGRCAADGQTCTVGPDDGGPADARPDSACGWSVSNVDACAIEAMTTPLDWRVSSPLIIDTDQLSFDPAGPAVPTITLSPQLSAGPHVALIVVEDFILDAGVVLEVHGARPLIILATASVRLDGPIRLSPRGDGACPAPSAASTLNNFAAGAGGGGGGYGSRGASSGAGVVASRAPSVLGGPEVGGAALEPLRPGCGGGAGETIQGTPNGGGAGGGAIQISSREAITVNASIEAPGAGGVSGASTEGGGGGGAGGAILLEAMSMITLAPGAALCANGGAGGAGFVMGIGVPPPSDGTCTEMPATGPGSGDMNSGQGGNGAALTTDATEGQDGSLNAETNVSGGGGGGGGGMGRIRLNGPLARTGSIVSPAPSTHP